jgi:hypothetical protein
MLRRVRPARDLSSARNREPCGAETGGELRIPVPDQELQAISADLKAKAIGALRRLQKLPDIVCGFFRDPKLSYILD